MVSYRLLMTKPASYRYFKAIPEIIRLAVMLPIRFRFRFGMSKIYCMNAGPI